MANVNKSYFKEKIREKLDIIRNDIGEARYLLYCDIIDECDDIEMLKQMTEIDMQVGYIKYVQEQISNKISELGFTIGDIEEIMSGFGEKDADIEIDELSSVNELTRLDEDDEERDLALMQEMARRFIETAGCDGERIGGCRIGQEVNVQLEEEQYENEMQEMLEAAVGEETDYIDEEEDDSEDFTITCDEDDEIVEDVDSNNDENEDTDDQIDTDDGTSDELENGSNEPIESSDMTFDIEEDTVDSDIDESNENNSEFEYEADEEEIAVDNEDTDSEFEYEADEEVIETDEESESSEFEYDVEEEVVESSDDNSFDIGDIEEDIVEEDNSYDVEEESYDVEEEFVETDTDNNDYDFGEIEEEIIDTGEGEEIELDDIEEEVIEEENTSDDSEYNFDNIEEEVIDTGERKVNSTTSNKPISKPSNNVTNSNSGQRPKSGEVFKDKKANKLFDIMSKLV